MNWYDADLWMKAKGANAWTTGQILNVISIIWQLTNPLFNIETLSFEGINIGSYIQEAGLTFELSDLNFFQNWFSQGDKATLTFGRVYADNPGTVLLALCVGNALRIWDLKSTYRGFIAGVIAHEATHSILLHRGITDIHRHENMAGWVTRGVWSVHGVGAGTGLSLWQAYRPLTPSW